MGAGTAREELFSLLFGEVDDLLKRSDNVLTEFVEMQKLLPATVGVAIVQVTEVLRTETGHLLAAHEKTRALSQQALTSISAQIGTTFSEARATARELAKHDADLFIENLRKVTGELKLDVEKTVAQVARKAIDEALAAKVDPAIKKIEASAIELDQIIQTAKDDIAKATAQVTKSSKDVFHATFMAVFCSTSIAFVACGLIYKFFLH